MKKFALTVTLLGLCMIKAAHAAEFFCSSGDVTCLIDAINSANGMPGEHTINLEPGSYTLQTINNGQGSSANGLPVITSSIQIRATADDLPTVIERDPNASAFRIFQVSGELTLAGVTIQKGGGFPGPSIVFAPAILNGGVTSLEDSIVMDSRGDFGGAINNSGTLRVIRSIIAGNLEMHDAGGIVNEPGGNLLVENSTIARNFSQGAGGIL